MEKKEVERPNGPKGDYDIHDFAQQDSSCLHSPNPLHDGARIMRVMSLQANGDYERIVSQL
jgi:anti-sigma factor ChrR (cupin superfamily)